MRTSASVIKDVDTVNLAILVSNEILCRGLDAVLRTLPDVGNVRRCVTREQAANLLPAEPFDVLIVAAADTGWLADPRVASAVTGARIIMLIDDADAVADCPVPADGVFSQQDLSPAALRDAVLARARGEAPVRPVRMVPAAATAPGAAVRVAAVPSAGVPAKPGRARPVSLTAREVEALSLLVKGMSNKQIARRLAISGHGAKRLVASILLKLDSPNRTTAAVAAIKAGIIECP